MAIDWTILGASRRGLAVEGITDKKILEAFLDAGESNGRWLSWRSQLHIEPAGKYDAVFSELKRADIQVWGLVDRDWRTNQEIEDLQREHTRLLVLPRITIENYCIDPDEIALMLPAHVQGQAPQLKTEIEHARHDWIKHGALSKILHERGANQFCRGNDGYPGVLLKNAGISDQEITQLLEQFREHLIPKEVLPVYHQQVQTFNELGADVYLHGIDGKRFFREAVAPILNGLFSQRKADEWRSLLLTAALDCPSDLIPIFAELVK